MIKILVNPKYEQMRGLVESIPDVFEKEGRVIYKGRNLIKVMEAPDGTEINVKRFHAPKGLNRLIYSLGLRKPKGRRAYEYPYILEDKGIGTPTVIALIEQRNALGLLGYTYFVTLQCNYGRTLYEVGNAKPGTYEKLAKALAHFAADMHNRGVLHKDFTPGNVLWMQDGEGYHFMIVDINRMKFGKIGIKEGLRTLCKLWGPKEFIRILASEYALVRNVDVDDSVDYVMKKRAKFWKRYGKKHPIEFQLEL